MQTEYGVGRLFRLPAVTQDDTPFLTSPTIAAGDGKFAAVSGGNFGLFANFAADVVAFTSLSELPSPGDTIVGATSGTSSTYIGAVVNSGTVGGGDAAGFMFLDTPDGAYQSENLNISGGTSNFATIGADSTTGAFGHDANGNFVVALTDSELQCFEGHILLRDAAGDEWQDTELLVETFGNASAKYPASSTAWSNFETVYNTDFGTNYNATRNAWATNVQDLVGTTALVLSSGGLANVTSWTVGITGDITGNLSGSVANVTGGINTAAGTITTLDGLDTAQDSQHSTTQARLPAALVSGRINASVGAMADDVITAAAHDESTAFPLASSDSGATAVARTGADSDTLETLSDEVAALNDPSAADIAAAVEAAILNEGDATALLAAIAAKVEEFLVNDGDSTATLAAIATAVRSELATELARVDAAVSSRQATFTSSTGVTLPSTVASTTNITAGTITTVTNLTNAPTNGDLTAAMKASVNAEVDAAIETYHLDHLLAATYDPSSKPGAADALLNELVENDGGVSRFTANALEQGPGGGSAPSAADIADAVWTEMIVDHSGVSGSTAEQLAAAGASGDPWETALPGSYAAGKAGYIIGNLVSTLSAGGVTIESPVMDSGELQIVIGDDYLNDNGRAISFTYSGKPSFTDGTPTLILTQGGVTVTKEGTVVSSTQIRFDLLTTETDDFAVPGQGGFATWIELSDGSKVTLQIGKMFVKKVQR